MYFKIFFVMAAYLIGSIPFGVLVSKIKGVDLKSVGSRNIGATNVLRTVGKFPALITLLGDSLKGTVVILIYRMMDGGELWESVTGISVILGHIYSIFLSFRGGKGVATGFGVLAIYSPVEAVVVIIIWLVTAFYTRYSSLAAVISYTALPIIFLLSDASYVKMVFAIVVSLLIILQHRANIKRLLDGTESKIADGS
ncbi:MAG: glycerol-3-phosphate 1-O-acyltransferase PlsY [Nitrospirae bacterium]|nr:glycerol-3-phosphate 1-O-acyltransferase PlsY [Nitrospirota bacterium]